LAATTAKGKKILIRTDVQGDKSAAEGDLKNSKADLLADEKTLKTTETSCTMKNSEWEERSKTRGNEEKALKAGIEILGKVAGVRTEAPTNPSLSPSPVALSQIRTLFLQGSDPNAKVINLLRETAKRSHSHSFEVFANKLAASVGGPFDKVNNMIQKMIFQLMAEQKDEDDHKNWCDIETAKSDASKTKKEEKITTLDLKIADSKAALALLASEITAADEMVATITSHMEEATDIRRIGKEENGIAIKEAKQAQKAIAQAIAVLLEFYKDSGEVPKESWEFLQNHAPITLPAEPSTWSASYTGVADPTKQPAGVVDVLKVIATDFAKMQSDSEAQEEMDQKAYDAEMKTCEIERTRRTKESELKVEEKKRHVDKMASMQKSKKHTNEELDSVKQYIKELQPACVEGDSTYVDRKASRQKEIAALEQAQTILRDAADSTPAPSAAAAFLAPINRVQ